MYDQIVGSALVSIYAFASKTKQVDVDALLRTPQLPSIFIMDNIVFYGEFEIIGHRPLKDEEFNFPISYGRRLDREPNVFLQWGLIHIEKSIKGIAPLKYIFTGVV